MISTHVKVILILAIITGLWGTGESCIAGSFTENPDNCNQYFLCINSGAATMNIKQECPVGQAFDPVKLYCTSTYECLICD